MNRISVTISLLLISFSSSAGNQLTKQNYEWYIKNYKYVNEVIESENIKEIVPVINTLGVMWHHKDGAIGKEISGAIAKAMIYHPKLIFSWFSKHPEQLNKWVEKIPYDLLTDYSGTEKRVKELNNLRTNLLVKLPNYIETERDNELRNGAISVLNKVKVTNVREID
ncbi:MAG: hypothetical protein OEZ39_16250 [Gammaproteobacteria bacterium]|nr:hypothetical protein [Gammaproteobacteria bacterium]MDH5653411.1 hypothetical protein [Gammaproteobacteria bacterium]